MKPAPIDPPEIHHTLWDGFSGTTGWDIGANCGQTLTAMLSRFSNVVAFEPATECWTYLERHLGRPGLVIHDYAISDHDGEIQLAALPDKIDTGQLVTPGTHGMEWSPDVPEAVARTVVARTVDSLAEEIGFPDFMKIDVEGHEKHVLLGAAETVAEHHPAMLIEFHTPDLHDFCVARLLGAGYTDIEIVRHPHYPADSHMWHQHGWLRAFFR